MNQFSKFFALLGLSASVALVGAGCAAEVEDPASELALADEANDSAELAVSADETTAESEDALSAGGPGCGWGGGACGGGGAIVGPYGGGAIVGPGGGAAIVGPYGGGAIVGPGGGAIVGGPGACGYGRGFDCLVGGRHFIRGPYYGPCGGYGRGYCGYGHAGWAYGQGRF
ncbi:hypothetical protein [Polyangium jinanense]|uniref:Glycine-rich protein n=1 Tax=Polyangium jinanense TaxID=2829994 RepID=A0A9X3X7D2_9BACT|nr:hypothetical protein [Polyangium jinanense]MDC3957472.1 hypothetical protein [Polyangium jinanense]MDC3985037.1 hypothetical protein [Polyangium jinanense]